MAEGLIQTATLSRRSLLLSLATAPLLTTGEQALAVAGASPSAPAALGGVWQRRADPQDAGIAGRWFTAPLAETIALPGSLERAGIGNPVTIDTPWTGDVIDKSFYTDPDYARYRAAGDVKVPFFLQPDSWYRGPAWYQRSIDIPESWAGKRVELFLERAHWETRVWIDGESFGSNAALHVPHRYDLGALKPGRHLLSIRVDNRMIVEIGHNGHGVTDHTQGNWNGIVGRIELRATEPVWIEGVDLYPSLQERRLRVAGRIGNATGKAGRSRANVTFGGRTVTVPVRWSAEGGAFEVVLTVDPADRAALRPWDEFDPALHEVQVELANGEAWSGRFGWRDLAGTPNGFTINGRPMMFRGALECAIFPETGHPATDLEPWRRIMRRAKEYGFNHLRFHSYCPPEAAFVAADEAGVYLQIETVWANQSVVIGSGLPLDRWVYAESDRILAAYGNHPSFVLMTHGNEPGGKTREGEAKRDAFLAGYVRHYKAKDPRRLWTSGAGWPEIADNQYHVTPTPRVQAWGEGLKSRINARPPETVTDYREFVGKHSVPVISHEIGQWCVYPNLAEARKYTGYLKAKNFEIFADRLRDHGMLGLAPEFLYASGRLQLLCYKEDIESALRTPGMGGFQLLGLQDFPGQGTALVGVLDPFWDDKGYVSATEYRRFCGATVPLARLPSRIVRSGDTLPFTIDVAHFGARPIPSAAIAWKVVTQHGDTLAQGRFDLPELPLGNAPLNLKAAPVLSAKTAFAAKLVVDVLANGASIAQNDWDLWVYPALPATPSSNQVRIARALDQQAIDDLARGGKLLLGVPGEQVVNHEKLPVQVGFSTIFWNTLWTERQAPTTLGVLCDPQHPALRHFPTPGHSDWQWWYPLHRAGALRLDLLPAGTEPIVRIIDDWFTARPLALVVELAVGKGKLVLCGCTLDGTDAQDPVTRQLTESLVRYMESEDFRPATQVSVAQIKAMMRAGGGGDKPGHRNVGAVLSVAE